jgi:hypothetical protein
MNQFGDEKITPTTLRRNYTSPILLLFHFQQSLLEMVMVTPKSLQEVTIKVDCGLLENDPSFMKLVGD